MKIKICGLTTDLAVDAALEAGADFLGVVFYPKSPRHLEIERAAELLELVPEEVGRVGLFVDPDDALLDAVMNGVRLDYFQLHGRESPERIEAIRLEYGMPVIKALGVGAAQDLAAADAYAGIADWLMFDAKAPQGAERPGGNAQNFDWSILKGRSWPCPWFLAGGLNPDNVAEAVALSGARAVDVSSGVESAPGVKDPDLIRAFIRAARQGAGGT